MFMNVEFDDECSDSEADPLDAEDFDHIAFINKRFPNEVALAGLDSYVGRLRRRQQRLDEDIQRCLRQQALAGKQARAGLDSAQEAIEELFQRIESIKAKAEQSEVLVSDVCRDIKSLDSAKKNLVGTVLALKRVHMLVTALDQLRSLMSSRQYEQASQLVCIVDSLAGCLQEFKALERVNVLIERKVTIVGDLKVQLLADYASVLKFTSDSSCQGVDDAYHCVNAMGRSVRQEVITQFCLGMLEDYKSTFQPPAEASALDNTAKRFGWLKKALGEFDDRYSNLFPESWRVPCGLCEHFCHITRQHLVEVLTSSKQVDPPSVVRALKTSIDFENQLARKFEKDELLSSLSRPSQAECARFARGFGLKYAEVLDDQQQGDTSLSLAIHTGGVAGGAVSSTRYSNHDDRAADEEPAESLPRFKGIISECFDEYIGSWVQHEESELLKLCPNGQDKIVSNDDDDEKEDDEDDLGLAPKYLLASAPELFAEMKKSMTKCAAFSTDKTLYNLFQAFKTVIGRYMERLVAHMPKGNAPLDADGIRRVCAVIGTAEYFDETLPMLSDSLLRSIDESYKEKIDFSKEQASIDGSMNRAMQALVLSADRNLDEVFAKMNKVNWEKFSQDVEDQSAWVSEIAGRLSGQLGPACTDLSKLHYRFFCDKLVQAFVVRFMNEIYRCRKISEQGAQQLLLDTSFMKTTLLEAPVAANKGRPMPPAFNNYVQGQMGRVEGMLKVLSSGSMDKEAICTMIGEGSEEDVARLMSLKVGYEGDIVPMPPPREVAPTWADSALNSSHHIRSGMQQKSNEIQAKLKNKFTNVQQGFFHGSLMSNNKARAKQESRGPG